MNTFIYFLIFIIGTLFGSFFTLAVYRIPINQSIAYGRSYCPKCNHRLEFLDLIPVLSYLFLGGKCRYCKEKIRARYILLEILSGITFFLFAISLNINIYNIQIEKLVYLVVGLLFISSLFIIGGIEKENHYISYSVLLFGAVIEIIYIIYLYILNLNIYKYVICLFLMLILAIFNVLLKRKKESTYMLDIILLFAYISFYIKFELSILSLIITLVLSGINLINKNTNNRLEKSAKEKDKKVIPIGFYLCFINIVMIIIQNLMQYKY